MGSLQLIKVGTSFSTTLGLGFLTCKLKWGAFRNLKRRVRCPFIYTASSQLWWLPQERIGASHCLRCLDRPVGKFRGPFEWDALDPHLPKCHGWISRIELILLQSVFMLQRNPSRSLFTGLLAATKCSSCAYSKSCQAGV